jgi:hypothetical protein
VIILSDASALRTKGIHQGHFVLDLFLYRRFVLFLPLWGEGNDGFRHEPVFAPAGRKFLRLDLWKEFIPVAILPEFFFSPGLQSSQE